MSNRRRSEQADLVENISDIGPSLTFYLRAASSAKSAVSRLPEKPRPEFPLGCQVERLDFTREIKPLGLRAAQLTRTGSR